jgi:type IV secretory pathway protease TraF
MASAQALFSCAASQAVAYGLRATYVRSLNVCAGDILVNGTPKQQATWAKQIGYVEQMVSKVATLYGLQYITVTQMQSADRLRSIGGQLAWGSTAGHVDWSANMNSAVLNCSIWCDILRLTVHCCRV